MKDFGILRFWTQMYNIGYQITHVENIDIKYQGQITEAIWGLEREIL